jgi:hypothetical protein
MLLRLLWGESVGMSDKGTASPDRHGVDRDRRSSRLRLAFSTVTIIALVLGLINDTLGVKTAIFGPDSPPSSRPDISSRPDTSTIAKNLSIENRVDAQGTMGLEQEDDGTISPTMIRWHPTFLISNENTIPLPIVDLDVHFPEWRTEDGDVVLLKKEAEGIIVYQDVRDYLEVKRIPDEAKQSNEEFSRTPGRVVIPAGGGERILEFKHLYSLEIGGQPVRFTGEKDFIHYLGQYLDLKPDPGDGYRCGSKKLDVTIRTPNEAIAKQVGIFLTPVGCTLRIPGG